MSGEYLDENRAELRGANRGIHNTITCCGIEYRLYQRLQMKLKVSDKFITSPHMLVIYLRDGAAEPDDRMKNMAIRAYSGQFDWTYAQDGTETSIMRELTNRFTQFIDIFNKKNDIDSE